MVPLDWIRVDLQNFALQGQDEDAPTLSRVDEFAIFFFDEVQAVLHEAQR